MSDVEKIKNDKRVLIELNDHLEKEITIDDEIMKGVHKEIIDRNKRIIESLEKQIPMKPIQRTTQSMTGDFSYSFECPVCGGFVGDEYDEEDKVYKFCYTCGQAIDWSDEDGR